MAEGGSVKEVGSSMWRRDRALCGAGSPSLGRIRAQSTARVRQMRMDPFRAKSSVLGQRKI